LILKQNISLLPYNTFGIDVKADYLLEFFSVEDLQQSLASDIVNGKRILAVGCGSNLLFVSDFKGIILHSKINFITVVDQSDEFVFLEVGSGVVWDDFVQFCVDNNYYGAENLSLIPGQTGAATVQNIGAYGVEIQSLVEMVKALEVVSGVPRCFTNSECRYDYRNSIFKNEAKDKFIITSTVFKLSKIENYSLDYQQFKSEVEKRGTLSLQNVRNTIIEIRQQKLPDTTILGNAGSFFKNPYCSRSQFEVLKRQYAKIPFYPVDNEFVKLPAAWLIEQSGCKGMILGNAQVYDKQALVIINRGNAKGNEVVALAQFVQRAVFEKFAIRLEPEVNYIA
jgi:UDP-N-acetylmuramate dehydrogenase